MESGFVEHRSRCNFQEAAHMVKVVGQGDVHTTGRPCPNTWGVGYAQQALGAASTVV